MYENNYIMNYCNFASVIQSHCTKDNTFTEHIVYLPHPSYNTNSSIYDRFTLYQTFISKIPNIYTTNPDFKNKIICTLLQKYLINICKILHIQKLDLQKI